MTHSLGLALGEERVVGGSDHRPDHVVKSAGRVILILELFDVLKREAVVSEISDLLNFPQSSTSVLLSGMARMGYLTYNPKTRAYSPTMRVALLGNWINSPLVGDGALLRLMSRLNQRTGQAVVLATRNQMAAEYIHIVQAIEPSRSYLVKGSRRSLIASGAGFVLLADLSDAEIRRIAIRINSEAGNTVPIVGLPNLMTEVEAVRTKGHALTCNLVTLGRGMISAKLPTTGGELFVIGLGGAAETIRSREIEFVDRIRDEITIYCAEQSLPDQ